MNCFSSGQIYLAHSVIPCRRFNKWGSSNGPLNSCFDHPTDYLLAKITVCRGLKCTNNCTFTAVLSDGPVGYGSKALDLTGERVVQQTWPIDQLD